MPNSKITIDSILIELARFFAAPEFPYVPPTDLKHIDVFLKQAYEEVGVLGMKTLDSALRNQSRRNYPTHVQLSPSELDTLMSQGIGNHLLGVLSGVRNGYTRQRSIYHLAKNNDIPSFIALTIRVADPSSIISNQAYMILKKNVRHTNMNLIYCLPLSKRIEIRGFKELLFGSVFFRFVQKTKGIQWFRTTLEHSDPYVFVECCSIIVSKIERLNSKIQNGLHEIMIEATESLDPVIRKCAGTTLMSIFSDRKVSISRLKKLFSDPNPQVRRSASRAVLTSSKTVQEYIFPLMFSDSNQDIRTDAMHVAEQLDYVDKLIEGAFDRKSNVRFVARSYIISRNIQLEYRKLALQRLKKYTKKNIILGSLGTLSEWGRTKDLHFIRSFTLDLRNSIRKEAKRTIEWIEFASPKSKKVSSESTSKQTDVVELFCLNKKIIPHQALEIIQSSVNNIDDFCSLLAEITNQEVSKRETFGSLLTIFSSFQQNGTKEFLALWALGLLAKWNPEIVQETTFLDVSERGLRTIPDTIQYLTNLEQLILYMNILTTIPDTIRSLTKLKNLNIMGNKIQTIPNWMNELKNLKTFDIQNNPIHMLPMGLTALKISKSQMNLFHDTLWNMTSLQYLRITSTSLTTLPESIGNLHNLLLLEIYGNKLKKLPESVGKLTMLRYLDANDNKLTVLPESIGNLHNLQELFLDKNKLMTIPESMGTCHSLSRLELRENLLAKLPESMGKLVNLEYLHLNDNQLRSLPDSFVLFSKPIEIYVSGNHISKSQANHMEDLNINCDIYI